MHALNLCGERIRLVATNSQPSPERSSSFRNFANEKEVSKENRIVLILSFPWLEFVCKHLKVVTAFVAEILKILNHFMRLIPEGRSYALQRTG
jgi:hypothetical protein